MAKKGGKVYWFKPRKYGWGWGLPNTREGWVCFGLFIFVWVAAVLGLLVAPKGSDTIPTKNIVYAVAVLLLDTAAFVYVALKHGEPPKWRWGKKK